MRAAWTQPGRRSLTYARTHALARVANFTDLSTSMSDGSHTLKHDVTNVELTVWLPSDVEATWRAEGTTQRADGSLSMFSENITC